MPRPRGRRYLLDATALVDLAEGNDFAALQLAANRGAATSAIQWAEALLRVQRIGGEWRSRVELLRQWEVQVLEVDQRVAEAAAFMEYLREPRALADRLFLAELRNGRLGLSADRRMGAAAADAGVQLVGVLVDYRQPDARERLL